MSDAPQKDPEVRMIPDPDYDPLSVLTLAELDNGSRLLKADLINAITSRTEKRWEALALAAWLIERRQNPKAKLEACRQMTSAELNAFMEEQAPLIPAPGDGDDQVDELAADPTASGHGSSSPAPGE